VTRESRFDILDDCGGNYKYETNTTRLVSKNPTFQGSFTMKNSRKDDSAIDIQFGRRSVYLNTKTNVSYTVKQNDSVYNEVFKLKLEAYKDTNNIYIDSIYFKLHKGILQIILSDKERYYLQEKE
ncbi:MAG TPA: hypothetical protein VF677_00575, partial [Flavobacterium sp.]